jgi:hypothetical protein
MTSDIITAVNTAEQAALATQGPNGLNVVPISVFDAAEGEVRICHFFMQKTIENLEAEAEAAFSCWAGLAGVQFHGTVAIERAGPLFTEYERRMEERFPERTLCALLRFTPTSTYSVTPGQGGRLLD